MASEPSDGKESIFLSERRRWGDGSNVYTRRFYKAKRINKNNSSATGEVKVSISNENSCVSNNNIAEKSSQTLGTNDKISPQQNLPESEALLSKDIEPVEEDEDATLHRSPEQEPPEIAQVVVPMECEKEVVPPESKEVVAPDSSEVVMAPGSSEVVVSPESNEMVLESREKPVALPQGSSEIAVIPENSDALVVRESCEVLMLPESRELVLPPHARENGTVEIQPESQSWPRLLTRVEDKVKINISGVRIDEIKELRWELETELDQVRSIFKKLEAKELQITAYNRSILPSNGGMVNGITNNIANNNNMVSTYSNYTQPQHVRNEFVERRALTRVNSEVGSITHQEPRLYNRSLSVSVVDNNNEFVEREKRTPKANQFYRNSEFLLGKDRLPPESNKKMKPNGRKEGENGYNYGYHKLQKERVFRSCNSLLQRLMKHKFGWVFNVPVDAKKLGLHDYHDIIQYPMDLGTVKTRLSQNYYKAPQEYAEDVRLVFHNAMTYNPKGQDVHVMAETLLQIFEERWAIIQTENNPDWRYQMYRDAGLPTPTSRKAGPTQFYPPAPAPIQIPHTPVPQMRNSMNTNTNINSTAPIEKVSNYVNVVRTPVPKKPKAKDPNKRDMTYEEKQKLSTNLHILPSEKLDTIVQIIKKRNSIINQRDDEIEVDIDSVDAETLWELDRFVTNYKKNLSKNKRKAEIALQSRDLRPQTYPVTNMVTASVDAQKEGRIGENNVTPNVGVEKLGDNASRSSSSSSSSSDSGSSSSDSDSDSSSADGSDGGH